MSLAHKHAILDVLMAVLDDEHAQAVVEHRKEKKSALTPFAAKLLAKQFALCPDPNAAAEEMILRGWRGFKAEWLEDKRKRGIAQAGAEFIRSIENGTTSGRGDHGYVEFLPAISRH